MDVPAWEHYARLARADRRDVAVADLVHVAQWRRGERTLRCHGHDPLHCVVAYAQDELIFENCKLVTTTSRAEYEARHRDEKLNKFGAAYRPDAPLLTHRYFADILVETAIDMHQNHGWTLIVLDSLRTMEAGYLMYRNAHPDDRASKLLSAPGTSAHNRALAADCMCVDATGREIDMGGHFDHSDMATNHRNYRGDAVSAQQQQHRLWRECAFQRGALRCGAPIAPLREEFWDDRVPGSPADFWRVLESMLRCLGGDYHLDPRLAELREMLRSFEAKAQAADAYALFADAWRELLTPHRALLEDTLHTSDDAPPPLENFIFHEWLNPIYDRDLRPHGLHLASQEL